MSQPRTDEWCVLCGMSQLAHCDLDEPGVDHRTGCPLMHHEFILRLVTETPRPDPETGT